MNPTGEEETGSLCLQFDCSVKLAFRGSSISSNGQPAIKHGAVSASAVGRFETEMLSQTANLAALADLPGRWIDAVHDRQPPKNITLEMDSSESPVHGD